MTWNDPSPWINQEFLKEHPEWAPAIQAEDANWQRTRNHHEQGLTWHQHIAADHKEIIAALQRMNLLPAQDAKKDAKLAEKNAKLAEKNETIARQAEANTRLQNTIETERGNCPRPQTRGGTAPTRHPTPPPTPPTHPHPRRNPPNLAAHQKVSAAETKTELEVRQHREKELGPR
jgi:hypothetical protein